MSQQEDDKEPIILPGQMSYDELPPITNEPEQKQDAVIDGQVNMFETAPKVTTEKTVNKTKEKKESSKVREMKDNLPTTSNESTSPKSEKLSAKAKKGAKVEQVDTS